MECTACLGVLICPNDESQASRDAGRGDSQYKKDNFAVARLLGLTKVYDRDYRNRMMDHPLHKELRSRLVFIFRLMKLDTSPAHPRE